MGKSMEMDQAAEMYAIGIISAEDLRATAASALEGGYDSPTLRRLAAAEEDDMDEIRRLFVRSLDELGIQLLSPPEAGLAFARRIARQMISGAVAPYDGARRIWAAIYTRFPQLKELTPFVGLASEYEDDKQNRDEYSRQILAESQKLLE
jgi:hypothetical protein